MEEQLRTQREALLKKSAGLVRTPGAPTPTPPPNPTVIRRIQNPDGTVHLIRSVARPVVGGVASPTTATTTPITTGGPPAPKRIFVTKDGKILSEQILGGSLVQPQMMKPASPATPASQSAPATPAATSSPGGQQKVQIVRSNDGKLQVRGLLPGQQLVQTPDGKLQIFTQQGVALKSNPATPGTPTQVVSNSVAAVASPAVQPPNKLVLATPNQVGVTPAAQIIPATPQQTVVGSPVKLVTPNAVLNQSVPNQIVATQLAPGSQIPPGTTCFVSGGKTYCIPKASATLAGANVPSVTGTVAATMAVSAPAQAPAPVANVVQSPQVNLMPSTPQTTLTPNIVNATSTTPTPAVQQPPKQMVEVKTLGQNVVTFKGNQMIVQGPDAVQAQLIAKQLATGAARLAMLNGKQVLVSTTPTIIQQQPQPQQNNPHHQQVAQQVIQQRQPQQILAQQQQQVVQQQQQVVQQQVVQQQVVQQQQQVVQQQQQVVQPQPAAQVVHQHVMTSPQSVQSPPVQAALPHQMLPSSPMENIKLPTQPLPPTAEPEQPAQQPAPVPHSSPIRQPMQITAQLVQTPQGPRIILQGIQGASLPREYLNKIQQQVKTQLLKAQAEAKQQNRVPPTKIAIQLHPSIQAQLEKDQPKLPESVPAASPAATQPQPELPIQPAAVAPAPAPLQQVLLPTHPISSPPMTSPTSAPPMQVMNIIRGPRPVAPTQVPQTSLASPRPVVLQQIVNTNQGQRFVLIGAGGDRMAIIASSASPVTQVNKSVTPQTLGVILPSAPNQPTAIFSNASNTATTTVASSQATNNVTMTSPTTNNDKFELTPDYIQKAISDALKSQNLSPEIEQKLLAMQNYTNERTVHSAPAATKKAAVIDPLSGEPMDDEWEPTSRPRSSAGGRKRKTATATSVSSPSPDVHDNLAPAMTPPHQPAYPVTPVSVAPTPETTPRIRTKSGQRSGSGQPGQPAAGISSLVIDEKRRQQAVNKLQQILLKHKEQLKKDIARKRALQEKELQVTVS
jgi:nucleosome-remodeling factor subunit BPTF